MDFDIRIKPFLPQAESATYRKIPDEGKFLVIEVIRIQEGAVLTIKIFKDVREVRLEDGGFTEEYQIRNLLFKYFLKHKHSGLDPLYVPGQNRECFSLLCFS